MAIVKEFFSEEYGRHTIARTSEEYSVYRTTRTFTENKKTWSWWGVGSIAPGQIKSKKVLIESISQGGYRKSSRYTNRKLKTNGFEGKLDFYGEDLSIKAIGNHPDSASYGITKTRLNLNGAGEKKILIVAKSAQHATSLFASIIKTNTATDLQIESSHSSVHNSEIYLSNSNDRISINAPEGGHGLKAYLRNGDDTIDIKSGTLQGSQIDLGGGSDCVSVHNGDQRFNVDGGQGDDTLEIKGIALSGLAYEPQKDGRWGKVYSRHRGLSINIKSIEKLKLDEGVFELGSEGIPSVYSISTENLAREGEGITFTITRSGNTSSEGSVRFFTENGTAKGGTVSYYLTQPIYLGPGQPSRIAGKVVPDFTEKDTVISFKAGEASKEIIIKTNKDEIREGTEHFFGKLEATNDTDQIKTESAKAPILDVTPPSYYSIQALDHEAVEGETLKYRVSRIDGISGAGRIKVNLNKGNSDLEARSWVLNFKAGQQYQDITINTKTDDFVEGREDISVSLTAVDDYNLVKGTGSASGFIYDRNTIGGSDDDFIVTPDGVKLVRILGNAGSDMLVGNELDNGMDGGTGDDFLYGGAGNDGIQGGAGNDSIWGEAGDDNIRGYTGHDFLLGGDGNDVITGGAGSDTMSGGSGADRFVYKAVSDSSGTGDQDLIFDFNGLEGDRIDLSAIQQGLSFIGSDAFSGKAGEVRFVNGELQANTSGDQKADFAVTLAGVSSFEKQFLVV
jgi:hypothetical protein